MQLVDVTDRTAWDDYVSGHPQGHPLQLWGWGEAKRDNQWTAHRLALRDGDRWLAAAQVLLWPIPKLGRFIAYVPRGPVAEPGTVAAQQLLTELVVWARAQRALYLRVEPAWRQAAFGAGWVRARHHLQMFQTYTVDLRRSEEELMAPMSNKHRVYIRQTQRRGVTVKQAAMGDLKPFYAIYQETATRAGFGIHSLAYYERLQRELGEHNWVFYAFYEGAPVAFLWVAMAGVTAYELYGGMNAVAAKVHANYLLKWHAFLAAKAAGCQEYDLNGRVSAGVSSFKAGFAPEETDYVGTYDYPLNRVGYQVWEHLWPVAKPLGRRLLRVVRRSRDES